MFIFRFKWDFKSQIVYVISEPLENAHYKKIHLLNCKIVLDKQKSLFSFKYKYILQFIHAKKLLPMSSVILFNELFNIV